MSLCGALSVDLERRWQTAEELSLGARGATGCARVPPPPSWTPVRVNTCLLESFGPLSGSVACPRPGLSIFLGRRIWVIGGHLRAITQRPSVCIACTLPKKAYLRSIASSDRAMSAMASLPPLKPIDHGSGFDRHILITGGAGFIASHVVILLCKKYSLAA